jgi:hypothetical protein
MSCWPLLLLLLLLLGPLSMQPLTQALYDRRLCCAVNGNSIARCCCCCCCWVPADAALQEG